MRLFFLLALCVCTSIGLAQKTVTQIVYFDFDKWELTPASTAELQSFIARLKSMEVHAISIDGHTDKKGSDQYNIGLSGRRATTVLNFLKNELPESIEFKIEHFGESQLLAEEDERQDKNRRVLIVVLYSDSKPEENLLELESVYEDVEEQRFEINLNETVLITGTQGTHIKIPPASIQTKKKMVARGKAVLILKEYYRPSDFLRSGLHTNSTRGLLQTAGMFYFSIVQENDTMDRATLKPLQVAISF